MWAASSQRRNFPAHYTAPVSCLCGSPLRLRTVLPCAGAASSPFPNLRCHSSRRLLQGYLWLQRIHEFIIVSKDCYRGIHPLPSFWRCSWPFTRGDTQTYFVSFWMGKYQACCVLPVTRHYQKIENGELKPRPSSWN